MKHSVLFFMKYFRTKFKQNDEIKLLSFSKKPTIFDLLLLASDTFNCCGLHLNQTNACSHVVSLTKSNPDTKVKSVILS